MFGYIAWKLSFLEPSITQQCRMPVGVSIRISLIRDHLSSMKYLFVNGLGKKNDFEMLEDSRLRLSRWLMSLLPKFKHPTIVEVGAELVSLLVNDNATFCSSYLLKRGKPMLSIEISARYILEYLS